MNGAADSTQADKPTPQGLDTATRSRFIEELARIVASPDFVRAPVMRRLLDFLVNETLAGRGEQLKAYAVAVDGLGRSADFDAQTDSYPRVQVGRLRRMLDAFYARHPNSQGWRLAIPQGRYRVSIAGQESAASEEAQAGEAPFQPVAGLGRFRPTPTRLALIALVLLLGIAGLLFAQRIWPARPAVSSAPTLALVHLDALPSLDAIEVDADAILLDGLRRSWLVAVLQNGAGKPPATDYQLSGHIAGRSPTAMRLRLTRGTSGELLWTGQALVPADRTRLREALDPLIAELIQPYGVIATDQRSRIAAPVAAGYACSLKFDQYRRERTAALHAESRDCVERTLAREPNNAMALAAKAFLMIDDGVFGFAADNDERRRDALTIARRAVAADPYSPIAYLTLARAARHNGGCQTAIRSARRALVLNPLDPDLHGLAAMSLFNCGDPAAEPAARRAIALDPAPPANFYTTLVFAALERGDVAGARKAAMQMSPGPSAPPGFFDFVFTVVAAAEGDGAGARAAWARVIKAEPAAARDLAGTFRRWSISQRVQRIGLRYLRARGIVANVALGPGAALGGTIVNG